MALFVHKYGGTSVGSIQRIKRIAETLARMWRGGDRVAVVLSAMGDSTDRLMALAAEIAPSAIHAGGRELDALLSSGEQVSAALLALALKHEHGIDGVSFSGAQAGIRTDAAHNKARILDIDTTRLRDSLEKKQLPVVAGFQGVNDDGDVTTLGRGGSDTSAVALAVALQAEACRIYTDVDGVYTTDPRIVDKARLIRSLTFEEMLEMAGLGAKVLQIRAVQFASKYNMPIHVLSSAASSPVNDHSGTRIRGDEEAKEKTKSKLENQASNTPMEKAHITGIAFNRDEAQLTLTGVPDTPGIAAQILGGVAAANIEVDMIVQNVGAHDGLADFTFTVHRSDYEKAREILRQTAAKFDAKEVLGDNTVVKVSIVGVGMRSHAGVAATMFKALADNRINIRMISTSEIKVSVVIDEGRMEDAVRVLHDAFGLEAA